MGATLMQIIVWDNYRSAGLCSHFELIRPHDAASLALTVNMPGLHNAPECSGAAALVRNSVFQRTPLSRAG
ncbi:MAG: hypothetical protein CM15mP89_1230 [Gammaproteobacteria bacterium]|nr:MAG: hypothetical protein CM15mP89_1230 [Gammaproteobacteria bacterium]